MTEEAIKVGKANTVEADPVSQIAARLRNARRAKGWTLERLAKITGLSIPTISRTLRGLQAGVGSTKEIADALGVELEPVEETAA